MTVAPRSFIALQRFGLGARPGDLDAIASDPRGAVMAEIAPGALIEDPTLPTTADWPGLKQSQLFEDRDLFPSLDLRAVLKGALRDHLGVTERDLATKVFPDSLGIRPIDGLIAWARASGERLGGLADQRWSSTREPTGFRQRRNQFTVMTF